MRVGIFVAAFLLSGIAYGAEGPLSLSLEQAMKRAERTVPELGISEALIREAEATRIGADVRLPVNPRVQFDVRPGIKGDVQGSVGWAAQAELTFEVADAAGARVDESGRRVDLARSEQRVSRLQARLLVLRVFVAAKIAAVQIEQARQSLAIAERLEVVARERLSAGAGNEIETLSADVELTERRVQLQDALSRRAAAESNLRFLLAVGPTTSLDLVLAVEDPGTLPELKSLVDMALNSRPDLRVIADRLALLSASDERLRREAKPKMGAFGGVDNSPGSAPFGLVGLSVELPFAQRNQGPRAQVAAARNTELGRLEVERRRIESEIRTVRALFEARQQQVGELRTKGIPAAEKRYLLIEEGWRAGRFDVLRLTSAAEDLVRIQNRRVVALEDLWKERFELERLVGSWPQR